MNHKSAIICQAFIPDIMGMALSTGNMEVITATITVEEVDDDTVSIRGDGLPFTLTVKSGANIILTVTPKYNGVAYVNRQFNLFNKDHYEAACKAMSSNADPFQYRMN